MSSTAHADQVQGIRSKITQPMVLRGGVMMLPLTATKHGDQWPQTLNFAAADNTILTGQVAWMEQAAIATVRHWTDDPRGLVIRPIRPEDDSSALSADATLGPYVLLRTQPLLDGALTLDTQRITPDWHDVHASPDQQSSERPEFSDAVEDKGTQVASNEILPFTQSPDRPDPDSPFEYWRWVILAERLNLLPPAPQGDDIAIMAAEHYASLWKIGWARLNASSLRLADQCREMLTKICMDRRQPMAAWIADPVQANVLLSRLLDFNRTEAMMVSDVVEWIDAQPPLFMWALSDSGDSVELAVVTARSEQVRASFSWIGGGPGTNAEAAPPMLIEPGVLTQVSVRRAPLPRPTIVGMPAPPEPLQQILSVDITLGSGTLAPIKRVYQISFGPRLAQARPPGVYLRPLVAPLTLAEAQSGQQRAVPDDLATLAQVRRIGGRWEVFVECHRPRYEHALRSTAVLPEHIETVDELRGTEAITLLLGPSRIHGTAGQPSRSPSGPAVWLTVPEEGFWKIVQSEASNDGTLQIHKRSLDDRWYCRIVLPEAWFSAAEANPALIALVRSHGDHQQLETTPNPALPWRLHPSRAAIDLSYWD